MRLLNTAARVVTSAGAAAIRAARSAIVIDRAHAAGGSVGAIKAPDPTVVCKVSRSLRRRAALADRARYPLGGDTARSTSEAYPSVSLPVPWGFPVEVSLLGELPLGAGNALFAEATLRQARHPTYEDEHDEESARIGATSIGVGAGAGAGAGAGGGATADRWHDRSGSAAIGSRDAAAVRAPGDDVTALYTFSVGGKGHPFHRHEGHRCFTAVAGSSGCRLGFSPATVAEVRASPDAFVRQLQFVDVPADGLFTVRFNGGVWHQFASLRPPDPAFFAVSVHTDETGGALEAEVAAKVRNNESSIGLLTQRLPPEVEAALAVPGALDAVPISMLVLEDP